MSIGGRLWLSQVLIIVGLVLFTALSFSTAGSIKSALSLRHDAVLSLRDTEVLMTKLRDAETGQRGYLLTGKASYLEPFVAASRIGCAFPARAERPIDNSPPMPVLAARIVGLCKEKMAELTATIGLRQREGLAAAMAVVNTDQGKMSMDRARNAADDMHAIQWNEIERQDDAITTGQRLQVIALSFGSALLTAIILINGAIVIRSLRRPLRAIRVGIGRITKGDLDAEVALFGNDELTEVARSFNDMTAELRTERANREEVEAELASTAGDLSSRRGELERHTQAIDLIGEMTNRLLGSGDEAELAHVVEIYAPKLFPGTRGALYAITNSRVNVRRIGAWNEPVKSAPDFSPDSCWAIRRGRPHCVHSHDSDIGCEHVDVDWDGGYICLPLVAHGETVGLLHIEGAAALEPSGEHARRVVSETIAAFLVNIRLRDSLRDQSIRDPVTGLFNRRYLEEALEMECARADRSDQPLGALMADIDHFKRFNDSFGHDAGDMVLKQFGEVLSRTMRSGDIVCRYGGEEFVMILPGADIAASAILAERVRKEIAGFGFTHHGRALGKITVSVGVASFDAAGRSCPAMMAAADQALYAAKLGGRDRVVTSGDTGMARALNEAAA
jgi:diguanylate cyclase (GGDEF)-like protein